ncbi:MAG: DivIVA domain-containing protein [Erysipelotrichaceae bacterium]
MVNKNFDVMRNGYNRYQVDDYVEHLAIEKERLEIQLEKVRKELVQQKKSYDEIYIKYKEIQNDLSIKENAAEGMSRMALREANLVIDTANSNADLIVKEALVNAKTILNDLLNVIEEDKDIEVSDENKKQIENLLLAIDK